MAAATPARVTRPSRWFLIGYYAIIAIFLAAAFFFWRPITVMDLFVRARLWTIGAHDRSAKAGPYRIHYIVAGSGRPVVLLHGLGMSGLSWGSYIPALAQRNRVYAIDLLGFGSSDHPDVDYSVALQTEFVRGFLDAERLQQVDLFGVSMGGFVALNFARLYPERVRRLIAADAAGIVFDPNVPLPFIPHDERQITEFQRLMTPKPNSVPRFVVRDMARRLRQQEWVIQRVIKNRASGREFLDGKLQSINVPVLLLWGEHDLVSPLWLGQAAHRQIPQSQLIILQGCGHLAMLDCKAQALPEIHKFLSSQEPEAGGVRTILADSPRVFW